jgi:hypothetical protein
MEVFSYDFLARTPLAFLVGAIAPDVFHADRCT